MSDPTVTVQPVASAAQPDPNAFQLRGPQPRVMRLSRKALAVVGVAAGLAIGPFGLRLAGDAAAGTLPLSPSLTVAGPLSGHSIVQLLTQTS